MKDSSIIGASTVAVTINTGTSSSAPMSFKTAVLKPNLINGVPTLTQEMLDEFGSNTKFIIRYDYVINESSRKYSVTLDGSRVLIKNSIPYYFGGGEVYIPIGKTLTLLNAQSCVLLNETHTDFIGSNTITADERPLNIYIASKVKGTYLDAYRIDTPVLVPENSILEFDGGSINDGAIAGQQTRIVNLYDYQIMKNVRISGTFRNITNILDVNSFNERLIK